MSYDARTDMWTGLGMSGFEVWEAQNRGIKNQMRVEAWQDWCALPWYRRMFTKRPPRAEPLGYFLPDDDN